LGEKKGQNTLEQLGQRKGPKKRLTTIKALLTPIIRRKCENEMHVCDFGKIHCGMAVFSTEI